MMKLVGNAGPRCGAMRPTHEGLGPSQEHDFNLSSRVLHFDANADFLGLLLRRPRGTGVRQSEEGVTSCFAGAPNRLVLLISNL